METKSDMAGVWLIQMGSFGPEIQKGNDVTQLAFAFVGFYGSGAVLVNKVFGKTVFPMGKSIL